MKTYSIRFATNYTRHYAGKDWDKWKLHSSTYKESNGKTKQFASIEEAEKCAKRFLENWRYKDPNEEHYLAYCKIYQGNEYIKTVER